MITAEADVSDLVQAMLPDGTALWVRVEDDDQGPTDTGVGQSVVRRLEGLPQTLDSITRSVREGLRDAAPDEVSLEFGIELAGKGGHLVSVLAEVGAKATLKVNVTWRQNGRPETSLTPMPHPTDEPEPTPSTTT